MEIALFIFYTILFSFFIFIIPFFKTAQIGKRTLIVLFLVKIAAGVIYARFFTLPKYYRGADTWRYYRQSLEETKWLLQNPAAFVKDLFLYNYSESGNIFSGHNTYWNNLKSNVLIKLTAVINIFTNNSYYTNIIFFNFLFLFGLVALFKVLHSIFPDKKVLIIAGIFLFPSTLFWCSGIHKDGLLLSATGVIIYTFNNGIKNRFSAKSISITCFCALLIFSLRNYIILALFPALLSWWLCKKYPGKNWKIFAAVYIAGTFFLVIISSLFPSADFLFFIAGKQHEFLLLEGSSKLNVPELQPDIAGFISFIPYAADMAFFRPYVNEIKNLSYIPAIGENIFVLLLLISSVFFTKKGTSQPVVLVLIFFSISVILLAGYTIPFTGAITRYKSLVLPLLITPLLCIIDFSFLKNKKKKY